MASLIRIGGAAAAATGLALAVSCTKPLLPTAPSELSAGVVIYGDANFGGKSAHIATHIANLFDYRDGCNERTSCTSSPYGGSSCTTTYDWDDCISSIKVAAGWGATIYRDSDFHGESLEVKADVLNLQLVAGTCDHDGLNDCISSMRVYELK
jgi:hypothetical protein